MNDAPELYPEAENEAPQTPAPAPEALLEAIETAERLRRMGYGGL